MSVYSEIGADEHGSLEPDGWACAKTRAACTLPEAGP